MSRTWKWILGILAVLVVVAVAAAAVFVWRNHAPLSVGYRFNQVQPNAPAAPGTPGAPNSQQNPASPYGFRQYRAYPFGGLERRAPMMGARGFGGLMPFGFGLFLLGGLFRLLIPIGILVLVAILFYQLGRHAGAASVPPTPPSAPAAPQTPLPGRKVAKS